MRPLGLLYLFTLLYRPRSLLSLRAPPTRSACAKGAVGRSRVPPQTGSLLSYVLLLRRRSWLGSTVELNSRTQPSNSTFELSSENSAVRPLRRQCMPSPPGPAAAAAGALAAAAPLTRRRARPAGGAGGGRRCLGSCLGTSLFLRLWLGVGLARRRSARLLARGLAAASAAAAAAAAAARRVAAGRTVLLPLPTLRLPPPRAAHSRGGSGGRSTLRRPIVRACNLRGRVVLRTIFRAAAVKGRWMGRGGGGWVR